MPVAISGGIGGLVEENLENTMADNEKKTYIVIKDATIKKIYDAKMKKKVIEQIGKSAKAVFSKGKDITLTKPTGWTKEKDRGFIVNISLESLIKKAVRKEIHFSAKIKMSLFPLGKGEAVNKFPEGTGTVKNSATMKKIDDEAVFIAGHVTATLIKDKVIPLIKTL